MNNKALGTKFETEACEILAKHGYWVHFITPDARGAQPFDIIAAKNGKAYAIECKTLSPIRNVFSINRLEDNQKLSFSKWMACGNGEPIILIKHGNDIVSIEYIDLINMHGSIDLKTVKELSKKIKVTVNDIEYNIYGVIAYDLK